MAPSIIAEAPPSPPLSHIRGSDQATQSPLLKPALLAPPTQWTPKCHPREPETTRQVNSDFLQNWDFPTEKSRKTFVDAGFSRVTCFYFPLALDDRIHFACRLLTILFLIDDILDDMSYDEGEAYNAKLMPIMRGDVKPDLNKPVEWIMYDLWESMRAHDLEMANEVLEPTFVFMRAQTDPKRTKMRNLGQYLEYRERDVGKALLSALMRFSMALHLTPDEQDLVRPLERNCAKQISVVNDICSWEKEVVAARSGHQEGSAICSAVSIIAQETDLPLQASKRLLWTMVREWSNQHDTLVEIMEKQGCSESVQSYLKGLEYQMSGNEEWSLSTLRFKPALVRAAQERSKS